MKIKKEQLVIILLAGIFLVVAAMPDQSRKKKEEIVKEGQQTHSDYEKKMEEKLEKTLSQVEGVGRVKVMITLESTSEKVIEKDEENSLQSVEEKDFQGGMRASDDSTHKETTIYGGEEEKKTPYIKKEISPKIEGVVVIAQGGNNRIVIKNIAEAVQALFEVDPHKIKIMKMIQKK